MWALVTSGTLQTQNNRPTLKAADAPFPDWSYHFDTKRDDAPQNVASAAVSKSPDAVNPMSAVAESDDLVICTAAPEYALRSLRTE
jgi:hypothetical protein